MSLPSHPGSAAPGPNLVGRQLGRYEIVSFVASGGMASVYAARALGLAGFERLVALKVLHPHLAHEQEFVSMFLDEARLAAGIRHPNVVATLDISSSEAEGLYLVMEYVDGDHLGKLQAGAVRDGGRLPVPVVLRIVADALQGLGAAHDLVDAEGNLLQLVHRDVSPHNLLVGLDGVTRLTDFGVARAEVRLAATRDGQFKGKLGYLAPEQVATGACDRRSDLFAMGVVLWECLAGRRLFRGDDTVGLLRAVLQQPIPSIAGERPELARLEPVLARALARSPEQRFQTARAFLEAIEEAAEAVGGFASQRQVAEAVRRFAPPRIAHRAAPGQTALQQHLLAQSGIHAARTPTGTFPGRTVTASYPGPLAQTGTHPQPGYGQPSGSGSFPRHHTGLHPQHGTGLFPAQEQARKQPWLGLGAAIAAVLLAVGITAFALRPEAPAQAQPAAAAPALHPIDAALLDGPDDAVPRLLEGAPPVSPNPGLALAPTIVLRLHIDTGGNVLESRVYRSRLDLQAFEEAAIEAARRYRFTPAKKAGQPVPAWFNWPVTFTRPAAPSTILRMKGSDTIGADLAPALARAFRARHPEVAVEVEALGTGTGFAGLFDGTADVGAASRPVTGRELERAARLGVDLQEFVIGYDGVAVIVHPDNRVRSLTVDQLARIFTGQVENWRELGGADLPIRLLGRPASSGTHAFFKERVLRLGDVSRTDEFAAWIELREHNDELTRIVAADPGAVSYVGLGSVDDRVRVVPIAAAPGRRAVLPGTESVTDGSYPIYRPLLLYTKGRPAGELAQLIRFVLSADGRRIVAEHHFVPSEAAASALVFGD